MLCQGGVRVSKLLRGGKMGLDWAAVRVRG